MGIAEVNAQVPWPTASRYSEAVQRKDDAFTLPLLQKARFDTDGYGVPTWLEGQSAVTFLAETDDGSLAVRCLKRPLHAGMARYRALGAFQREHPTSSLVAAQWHEDAVIVDDHKWPVVTMRHVFGGSLCRFVETAIENRGTTSSVLGELAGQWRTVSTELYTAGVAHSDLQHDNVRVTEDRRLCLIDLDSVWLSTIAQSPPNERGHRHFQHPERSATGHWDQHVDAFSALVIYVSLRALAADPELWSHHNGENLIFTEQDYVRPGDTNLWHRLASSPDLEVRHTAVLLDEFCRRTVKLETSLEQILSSSRIPDGPKWTSTNRRESEDEPWWHDPADVAAQPVPATDWWQDDNTEQLTTESEPAPAAEQTQQVASNGWTEKRLKGTFPTPPAPVEAPASSRRRNGKVLVWVIAVLLVIAAAAAGLVIWGPW